MNDVLVLKERTTCTTASTSRCGKELVAHLPRLAPLTRPAMSTNSMVAGVYFSKYLRKVVQLAVRHGDDAHVGLDGKRITAWRLPGQRVAGALPTPATITPSFIIFLVKRMRISPVLSEEQVVAYLSMSTSTPRIAVYRANQPSLPFSRSSSSTGWQTVRNEGHHAHQHGNPVHADADLKNVLHPQHRRPENSGMLIMKANSAANSLHESRTGRWKWWNPSGHAEHRQTLRRADEQGALRACRQCGVCRQHGRKGGR